MSRGKRYCEDQIIKFLEEIDAGAGISSVARSSEVSEPAVRYLPRILYSIIYNGQLYRLVMGFGSQDWNAFEGVCLTGGKVYAVWPKVKANTVQHMFESLSFTQYWCITNQDITPGYTNASGVYWMPIQYFDPTPVPKPDIYP